MAAPPVSLKIEKEISKENKRKQEIKRAFYVINKNSVDKEKTVVV